MTNNNLIIERARYYGRKIQEKGNFRVEHAFAGHKDLQKIDHSKRPDLNSSKIKIDERGTGYHDVLKVGRGRTDGFFPKFSFDSKQPEFLQYMGYASYQMVGKTLFRRMPKYKEVLEDEKTLTYASYTPFFNDSSGRPGDAINASICLPASIIENLISEIEGDANILHAIFHYFYYPAYGRSILPAISRNGLVHLSTLQPIIREKLLPSEPFGPDYTRSTKSFNYTPLDLAGIVF